MERKTTAFFILFFFMFIMMCHMQTSDAKNIQSSIESSQLFRVLDISERTYDGGPAIAVLCSESLDPKKRHDEHLRISSSEGLLKSAWVLSDDHRLLFFPHVESETEYSVSVLESLRSASGQQLSRRVSKTITTRKITPIVSFASEGFVLPAKTTDGLPVVTVNVENVEIEFFRLNEKGLVHFVNWKNTTGRKDYYKLSRIQKYGDLVFSGCFDLNAPRNKRTVCHIPVEDISALQAPGVYLAVMREPGEYAYNYQATYFLVSDIGLHARIYENESLLVTSSLSTGSPLPDVSLTFYDKKGVSVGEGQTDLDGRYRYPEKLLGKVFMIKAVSGGHISVLPLNVPALDMSEFDLGKRSYQAREIYIFSPRDLYRPGEKVIVSALLRNYDGRSVEALPLKAKLYRADGREMKSFTWHARDIGSSEQLSYYQTELDISKEAQTGLWSLKLWDNPSAKSPAGVFEFHVEDFLPERMKLELSSEQQAPGPEDDLKIDISGEYLYGAPAAGNTLSARVRVRAKREMSEKLKGFQFGDVRDETYQDHWELSETTMDDQGKLSLTIPSRWKEIKSPLSVRVIASLYESGGRPVVRNIEKTIWPGKTLIGIRPLFDEKSADEGPVKFEVAKINPDGTLVPANNLMVELTKEDRDYYWEYSESTGWQYRYTEKKYQFLTETLNIKAGKPAPYTLQLQKGQYVLAIRDTKTNLITSLRFRVGAWWYYGADQGGAARPDKVVLTPDKPAYRPGDIVQLTVTPPHDGDAVILVEGESLLWFKRMKVSAEGTVVEIPVSASWDSHNIYISAVVFRPASAKEKITPNRAVGLVHLPLDRSSRKLSIDINAPEKVASQGPMTVRLKLETGNSKLGTHQPASSFKFQVSSFVTLAAVDVGILNITEFKTPDPFGWFFERRRYDVNSYDIYGKVIENLKGQLAKLRFGGDADFGGKRPESEVKLISLFQGPMRFDDNGEALLTFDLPDFNGRLRLMAVAFTKDSFGSAETEVTVAAPTVTQLAMPRFLAPEDVTEFTLDVHNLSGDDQQLTLEMSATNPLKLERGERILQLADQQKTTLRFPVKSLPFPKWSRGMRGTSDQGIMSSTIRMELEGEGIALARDWQLGIRPGYPGIVRKVRKILNKDEKIFMLGASQAADLIPSTVDVSLKISPVIPLDIRNAMQGLISYPYGCLEQTASRAYPLLFATPERVAQFNLPRLTHEERISRLEKGIQRLSTMQLASGGFGLWNKSSPETPWLTVYATDFLVTARDLSVDVPEDMLDNALERLEKYLSGGASLSEYGTNEERLHLDFAVRSYAAYVLAKVSWADLGTLRTLYDNHRKESGSSLPLAHLGIALEKMGDNKRSKEALKLATEKRCSRYGYWGDYGSLIRDLGLTIALFIENKADGTEGFDKLMLDLEDALHDRQWFSTQEKFAIFKAGLGLEGRAGKEWKGRMTIAGKESVIKKKGAYIASPSVKDLTRGITFASETPGFLYASAIISGYTKTPPPKDDSHISIERELYDSEGNFIQRNEFNVGELLVAHLRINSKEWIPDALVADLLPAGFELENQNLMHSVKLDDIQMEGKSIWRLKEQADMVHEEYLDDRYVAVVKLNEHSPTHLFYLTRVVSPGTFTVPPPFVESMYRPEIRGIGETPEPVKVLNKNN
ncbi:alpha-2-macroglobulin family protein [Desulfonema magnum]|nr:alpha-2-macroglobulin [Desulfonema magnum]